MQNKLHTFCHPETSLRVTKCIEKSKFSHFQILLFSILYSLFSIPANAQQTQPYEWDWAISGGASLGGIGAGFSDEQIYDIKVGTDNNYYFIATFEGPYNTNLKGSSVPSYNNSNTAMGNGANDIFLFSTDCEGQERWSQTIGGWQDDTAYNLVLDKLNNEYIGANDIFLFSTDCEGQVRWSQTIGGWQDDTAYKLVLDSLNNVYIGANVAPNTAGSGPGIRRPLHFTETDSIPFANTANGGGLIP